MAYIPGMPTNIPQHAQEKAQEAYNHAHNDPVTRRVPGQPLPNGMPSVNIIQQYDPNTSSVVTSYNPTSVYSPNISATPTPSVPTTPAYNPNTASISNTVSTFDSGHNGMPSSVEQNIRQQQANNNFINKLDNKVFGLDASSIRRNSNIAKTVSYLLNPSSNAALFKQFHIHAQANVASYYDKLPIDVIKQISEHAYKYDSKTKTYVQSNSEFIREVNKLTQIREAEYSHKTLKELAENTFWKSGEYQHVSYATASDYYQMQQRGYELVYVEPGCGKLQDKGGVYSVGRDRLAGLPRDVSVVMVDKDGNWKYIGNCGKRANLVEAITAERDASNARLQNKMNSAYITYNFVQKQLENSEALVRKLGNVFNKSRKQSDLDALQVALDAQIVLKTRSNELSTEIQNLGTSWALLHEAYTKDISKQTKYTVEDEARFQTLDKALHNIINNDLSPNAIVSREVQDNRNKQRSENISNLITEYTELKKRREENKYAPVFIDQDAIKRLAGYTVAMEKAVRQYNTWDSVTVHTEEGEDIGSILKRIILRDTIGDTDSAVPDLGSPTDYYIPTTADTRNANSSNLKEDLKLLGSAYAKNFTPMRALKDSFNNLSLAYSSGKINREDYINEEKQLVKQYGTTMLNNIVSNLSVFDLASFQHTFVAWRMAANPERYSNDPKFKRMQNAYKAIYGEDYRGAMDAAKMAFAMLDVKGGKYGDYIYLDGSDLRHASGDKYGMLASLAVGMLTDVGNIAGIGKGITKLATKAIGARTLTKAATEALTESLVRAGVAKETAEQFATSKAAQRLLNKGSWRSMSSAFKKNGKEFIEDYVSIQREHFKTLSHFSAKDIAVALGKESTEKFLTEADDALRRLGTNVAERSLAITKGTVVANTLGAVDDMIDDFQKTLFKVSCPAAGVVVGMYKGIKKLKGLSDIIADNTAVRAADKAAKTVPYEVADHVSRVTISTKSALAKVSNMLFDDVFDNIALDKKLKEIEDEFFAGVLGSINNKKASETYEAVIKSFEDFKDGTMRDVANNYISSVMRKLDLDIDDLTKLSKEYNYDSFEDMYSIIKKNLSVLEDYSPDAHVLINNFENKYATKLINYKLEKISDYINITTDHITSIQNALNTNGVSMLSSVNAKANPDFVQGISKSIANTIHDFMSNVNPDWAHYVNKAGDTASIYETAQNAMEILDKISLGTLDDITLTKAQNALYDYMQDLNDVYLKNAKDWQANAIQDVFSGYNYLDTISSHVAPNHANNDAVFKAIGDELVKICESKDINISSEDIFKEVLKTNPKDFDNLDLSQKSVLYRVSASKAANTITQINDTNLKKITDDLIDPNSALCRNAQLLGRILSLDDYSITNQVNKALENACAIDATRVLSDTLKLSGIDGATHLAVLDVLNGKANYINSIAQAYPADVASIKIREYVLEEVQNQLALHNGTYSKFHDVMADTVDVKTNLINLDAKLAADGFEEDPNCIDILFSGVRTTDTEPPKDFAVCVRGSSDSPLVLRKDYKFDVHDEKFASKQYGKTSEQLMKDYEALGNNPTVSRDEFQRQLSDYITQQKERALAEGKTLRFIGFNSSDAVTGNNRFITEVIRSCGINVNTANAIDYADILRMGAHEQVFDGKVIDALTRGVRSAIDSANASQLTLGITPTIAYDSKYICVDMLSDIFSNNEVPSNLKHAKLIKQQADYILEALKTTSDELGTKAYNQLGTAMNSYIDAGAFAKLLEDAGEASDHANGLIMQAITNASPTGSQLGLHKIIESIMDEDWVDFSKFDFKDSYIATAEQIHTSVLQLNKIHSSIRRVDLITDADKAGFDSLHKLLLEKLPKNSHAYTMAKAFKTETLTARQMFAVNKWLFDQVEHYMDPEKIEGFYRDLFIAAPRETSLLSDMGYTFIRDNVVDYTDDAVDKFIIKYLDRSEEGFRFAEDMAKINGIKQGSRSLKNYMDAVDNLFSENYVRGVQDKFTALQLASINKPIKDYYDYMLYTFQRQYAVELKSIYKKAPLTKDLAHKIATNNAVKYVQEVVENRGQNIRGSAIHAVINLDDDAFRTHLIRNCGGGLIIDPASSVAQGIDFTYLFKRWKDAGLAIDTIDFSGGNIKNRKLFRVTVPELAEMHPDDVFSMYNNSDISFTNKAAEQFNKGMRNSSFNASDMTLVNAEHMKNFKELFFNDTNTILDFEGRFSDWTNELYSCNMWTDMDLKQLVNPYYTDDFIRNIAQSTHQVRKNAMALHDFGTVINNPYMQTEYILRESGVYRHTTDPVKIAAQRSDALKQIKAQKQHICRLVLDKHNHYRLVDYTDKLTEHNFNKLIKNTIMLDEGMFNELADWKKATNVALKLQSQSPAGEWLSRTYKIYKDTIRSGVISMYLYGNRGTGVRNYIDATTKAVNEIFQSDEDIATFFKHYTNAVTDQNEYANIYRQIELEHGTVDREAILKFFNGNEEGLNKFNLFYGYEHTCGGDSLVVREAMQTRMETAYKLAQETGVDEDVAEKICKVYDGVYASGKFRGMTAKQLAEHSTEIHDKCMDAVYKYLHDDVVSGAIDLDTLSKKFYNYVPTSESWGDKLTKFPVLKQNKEVFEHAETRARTALYRTFLEGGATEAEAMSHVRATQFHYAGIGKVEDFMPFTQYKLYNALYWFDHAGGRPVANMWRFAQYNGDGYMTNQEISDMYAKYRQRQYYLYDAGGESAYNQYYEANLEPLGHILYDGVDSYLGLPREFQIGNIDLNGTHYFKFGNSFIEEITLITSCAAGVYMLTQGLKNNLSHAEGDTAFELAADKLRMAYDTLKNTPLYDSYYSPWKSYMDLIAFAYDKEYAQKRTGKLTSDTIWGYYEEFIKDKGTHSESIAALSLVGAVLSNLIGRQKAFDLNLGEFMALCIDPDARDNTLTYIRDMLCTVTGGIIPSVVGTNLKPEKDTYNYALSIGKDYLIANPTTYFDLYARLQKEMGYSPEDAKEIMSYIADDRLINNRGDNRTYFRLALELFGKGYTDTEVMNIFKQHHLPEDKHFLAMYQALPGYIKYDKDLRNDVLAHYMAMGMSREDAWAMLLNHPAIIKNGKLIALTHGEVLKLSKAQRDTYYAITDPNLPDAEFQAYFRLLNSMGYYYPKGKWSETYQYLRSAGYSKAEARGMLLDGYMLNDDGRLIDVLGQSRAIGQAFNRGYNPERYKHPLGYPDFNTYYQTIPDYCKYEKGAFKRTYAALKQLGFNYETSLTLIQQGAYLMDVSSMPNIAQILSPVSQNQYANLPVTDVKSLVLRYSGQIIYGADGKPYIFIDCSGLQRPRKTFRYSRMFSRRGSYGYGGRNYTRNYKKYTRTPKYNMFYMRKPFVTQGNVSTFNGFTSFRGSNKLSKPYTAQGYVSTYSSQNFLNGASYGMRKVYKIDMRQFKSGALSTKSAYPASYRNIVVAYRRNMYKDLYAKYGMSRMKMRANQQGYSNAAITRLRRNEIYNRERYAERRDKKAQEKVRLRATK